MIFLENAVIWTMAGQDYANGSILIDGGKIAAVGEGLTAPEGAERVDLHGAIGHARHD